MKIFGFRFLKVAGLASVAGLMLNVSCGGGGGGGTGGTPGTGGTGTGGTHTGGTTGTGGTGTGGTHTGGTTGTGGTAGASATGGTAGSSATGGTAGSSATAAAARDGGAGGTRLAAPAATGGTRRRGRRRRSHRGTAFSTFDRPRRSHTQGFGFNIYNPARKRRLAPTRSPAPTLTWDNDARQIPPTGSLKLDVTFTHYNEFVASRSPATRSPG